MIWESKEILKSPNLVGDIAQCPVSLPEIKSGNSSQKVCTNRYQTFIALSSCSGFLYFVPNTLLEIAAPRRPCLGYSKVYCDVRKRWLLASNQNRHITYSIFHILIPKSVLVFFTLAPTSFASISLLTFHMSTILAPLWLMNFERCRLQNLSISTLSCWLVLLGMVGDGKQHRRFSVAVWKKRHL